VPEDFVHEMRTKRGEQKEETCAESLNISVATRASPLRFPQMRFGTFISFGPPGCSSANLTQDGNVKSVSFEGCRGTKKWEGSQALWQ
jgi:hypothetical protein